MDALSLVISDVPALTSQPFTASFTFSEAVDAASFTADAIQVTDAGGQPVTGIVGAPKVTPDDPAVFTALITPGATGDYRIRVASGAVTDAAGNGNRASLAAGFIYAPQVDSDAPAVSDVRVEVNNPGSQTFVPADTGVTNAEVVKLSFAFGPGEQASLTGKVSVASDGTVANPLDVVVIRDGSGRALADEELQELGVEVTVVRDPQDPGVVTSVDVKVTTPVDSEGEYSVSLAREVVGKEDVNGVLQTNEESVPVGFVSDRKEPVIEDIVIAPAAASAPLPGVPAAAPGYDVSFEFSEAVDGFSEANIEVRDASGAVDTGARVVQTSGPDPVGTGRQVRYVFTVTPTFVAPPAGRIASQAGGQTGGGVSGAGIVHTGDLQTGDMANNVAGGAFVIAVIGLDEITDQAGNGVDLSSSKLEQLHDPAVTAPPGDPGAGGRDLLGEIESDLKDVLEEDMTRTAASQFRHLSGISKGALRRLQDGGSEACGDAQSRPELDGHGGDGEDTVLSGSYDQDHYDCVTGRRTLTQMGFDYADKQGAGAQGRMDISIQRERRHGETGLAGHVFGGYLSRSDVDRSGADGHVEGAGVNIGLYGAREFEGLFVDYYLNGGLGQHRFDLMFGQGSSAVGADGEYDYYAGYGGAALSTRITREGYVLRPRFGIDGGHAVTGDADVTASSADGLSQTGSLALDDVSGLRSLAELGILSKGYKDAWGRGHRLELTPRAICERDFGDEQTWCGYGASLNLARDNPSSGSGYEIGIEHEHLENVKNSRLEMSYRHRDRAGRRHVTRLGVSEDDEADLSHSVQIDLLDGRMRAQTGMKVNQKGEAGITQSLDIRF